MSKPKRVAVYVRVSTDEQTTVLQRRELTAWAEVAARATSLVRCSACAFLSRSRPRTGIHARPRLGTGQDNRPSEGSLAAAAALSYATNPSAGSAGVCGVGTLPIFSSKYLLGSGQAVHDFSEIVDKLSTDRVELRMLAA
jgi:hypothetical protein